MEMRGLGWGVFCVVVGMSLSGLNAKGMLIVSNYPERLMSPGMLGERVVTEDMGRLLYYHKSRSKKELYWAAWVTNQSDKPLKFQVFLTQKGPDLDGIYAGHLVTKSWLYHVVNPGFKTLVLSPHQRIRVAWHRLSSNRVSTGILEWKKQGGSIKVEMAAVDPKHPNNLPKPAGYRSGFFKTTPVEQVVTLDTKARTQSIVIGGPPYKKDVYSGIELKGNYGELVQLKVVLENPFSKPLEIKLWISPVAGVARGQALIDKHWVQTGFFENRNAFEPECVASWKLAPHQTRQVDILTSPQAGSYYPIHFVLQQTMK